MDYTIFHPSKSIQAEISLPSSKSISNRALIIRALCQNSFKLTNLSESTDTQSLLKALASNSTTIDIADAGTSMRFLTAYLSQTKGNYILTGSDRMKKRPIKELVDSLRKLGADIQYLENEGYPPLAIKGKTLNGGEIEISTSISSQFVSALLLIAPTLKNGLTLFLKGDLLSKPYITMTLKMMRYFGVQTLWQDRRIVVKPQNYLAKDLSIESDWSALAFILEAIVLSDSAHLVVNGLNNESWQGDCSVVHLFEKLGIKHIFEGKKLHLTKEEMNSRNDFNAHLLNTPDLAQAYCCALVGLRKAAEITGLNNLKLKESHRLKALKEELQKIGQTTHFTETSFRFNSSHLHAPKLPFNTHNDHRMAMCLAPLALLFDIEINDIDVVKKSYPQFWEDMKKMGFIISPLIHSDN